MHGFLCDIDTEQQYKGGVQIENRLFFLEYSEFTSTIKIYNNKNINLIALR